MMTNQISHQQEIRNHKQTFKWFTFGLICIWRCLYGTYNRIVFLWCLFIMQNLCVHSAHFCKFITWDEILCAKPSISSLSRHWSFIPTACTEHATGFHKKSALEISYFCTKPKRYKPWAHQMWVISTGVASFTSWTFLPQSCISLVHLWPPSPLPTYNSNTLGAEQNGWYLADNIFNWSFLEWKCLNFDSISTEICS